MRGLWRLAVPGTTDRRPTMMRAWVSSRAASDRHHRLAASRASALLLRPAPRRRAAAHGPPLHGARRGHRVEPAPSRWPTCWGPVPSRSARRSDDQVPGDRRTSRGASSPTTTRGPLRRHGGRGCDRPRRCPGRAPGIDGSSGTTARSSSSLHRPCAPTGSLRPRRSPCSTTGSGRPPRPPRAPAAPRRPRPRRGPPTRAAGRCRTGGRRCRRAGRRSPRTAAAS